MCGLECADAAGVELEYHTSGGVDSDAVACESPAVVFEHDMMGEKTAVGFPFGDDVLGIGLHDTEPVIQCVQHVAGENVSVDG